MRYNPKKAAQYLIRETEGLIAICQLQKPAPVFVMAWRVRAMCVDINMSRQDILTAGEGKARPAMRVRGTTELRNFILSLGP